MPLTRRNHRPRRVPVVIITMAGLSTPVTVAVPSAGAAPVAETNFATGEFTLPAKLVSQVEAVPVATLVAQAEKRPRDTNPA